MSEKNIIVIIICIYTVWGIYSGFKFLSGRSKWLDTKRPLNVIVKCLLSLLIGYIIAAFYLIYLIIKAIARVSKL